MPATMSAVSIATRPITPRQKSTCSFRTSPSCATDAIPRPRQILRNPITTASTRAWCNAMTATTLTARQPCARCEPCPAGCRLLQVPCRQAGSFRLRARAGEDRGLQQLPHAPRFHQSSAPQGEPVNMLCLQCHTFPTRRPGARTRPQSVGEVSGLHHVSHPDSWLQLQQCLFQVGRTDGVAEKTRSAIFATGDFRNRRASPEQASGRQRSRGRRLPVVNDHRLAMALAVLFAQ